MSPISHKATSPSQPCALVSYVSWVREIALPFWAERGFDPSVGLFEEALDFSGLPMTLPHRAMVQARQVYVFAHAALLGWHDQGHDIAERAAQKLIDNFCVDYGGQTAVVFAMDRSGTPVVSTLDAYTHAFVLFAFAWVYRLTGQRRFLAMADRIHAFITSELTDPTHGGLLDSVSAMKSLKRQNPVMHLFEAYLALEESAPGRGYWEHAEALIGLFERHLRSGVIIEKIQHDWSGEPLDAELARWEPGHHYEWAWLLERRAAMAETGRSRIALNLCSKAAFYGHAPTGLIYDELSADFTVTGVNHRLWPHTEAIKAALCGHTGIEVTPEVFAEAMADRLMSCFLAKPFSGGWIDRIDAAEMPLVDRVPASSLYHIMIAATEVARVAQNSGRSAASE